ncbi:hypothetical protein PYCCODRAFT_687842 [Trametes coccinea BRFM310]|uniref:Uncharacterized protein n=1 Tax=Trametes coccinea (strain BRFM310) TaxID=1353009 RepID=A0A1Y2IH85_TRAC3|nr:hypothetical protein PYCCODRAFT_687842 [Trametes coccinea BRFM310]
MCGSRQSQSWRSHLQRNLPPRRFVTRMSQSRSASVSPGAGCPVATVAASPRPSIAPEVVQGASSGTKNTAKMTSQRVGSWCVRQTKSVHGPAFHGDRARCRAHAPESAGSPFPCGSAHPRPHRWEVHLHCRGAVDQSGRARTRGVAGSVSTYSTFNLRPAGVMRRGLASSQALCALSPRPA